MKKMYFTTTTTTAYSVFTIIIILITVCTVLVYVTLVSGVYVIHTRAQGAARFPALVSRRSVLCSMRVCSPPSRIDRSDVASDSALNIPALSPPPTLHHLDRCEKGGGGTGSTRLNTLQNKRKTSGPSRRGNDQRGQSRMTNPSLAPQQTPKKNPRINHTRTHTQRTRNFSRHLVENEPKSSIAQKNHGLTHPLYRASPEPNTASTTRRRLFHRPSHARSHLPANPQPSAASGRQRARF